MTGPGQIADFVAWVGLFGSGDPLHFEIARLGAQTD